MILLIAATGCSENGSAAPKTSSRTENSSQHPAQTQHPTLTPGIEPCNFVTYNGRRYQQDLRRGATEADVGRSLGRPKGDGCGAYSPRGVNAFASRGESVADAIIVVDNYAPIRYVVQPPDLCSKEDLTIALGRHGVYHGRSSLIVLVRNVSQARCTLSAELALYAVNPNGKRMRLRARDHPRSPLLPGQALNILIGSGSTACRVQPQYATLLEVRIGLVTGAYLRHSQVVTNCGTPEVFEMFAEPLN